MEEEGIGLVLARASELRSKITNCIDNATNPRTPRPNGSAAAPEEEEEADGVDEVGGDQEDAEAQNLLNIRDALESLESQLSSLQALQQQQQYEREAALAEIDYSRKMLLNKLKEYKGEDLEVIHETSAFASESVEHNNDLLLPPYPTRPPRSLVLDNGYLSHFTHKSARNGVNSGDPTNEVKKNQSGSERNQMEPGSKNSWKGLGLFISSATKTMITLVGVISILSLAGFEPRLRKRDTHFKFLGLFQQPFTEEKSSTTQCPPGKVLVVEDGETRCLVKERVEIPFESVVATPDVSYGCG
ncbi:hypothetical protein L1049_014536 [Liquidambar formosana]|uniref:Plastid division protein PDV2 n=1 Tax=Liquidambar formosana TaxID=63359 RepID=A0AAP0RXE2_LIQFO